MKGAKFGDVDTEDNLDGQNWQNMKRYKHTMPDQRSFETPSTVVPFPLSAHDMLMPHEIPERGFTRL